METTLQYEAAVDHFLLSLGDQGEDQAPFGDKSRTCRDKAELLVDSYSSLIFRVRIGRNYRCSIFEEVLHPLSDKR